MILFKNNIFTEQYEINSFNLKFKNSSLESNFREKLLDSVVLLNRVALVLAFSMYSIFLFLDYILIPESFVQQTLVRLTGSFLILVCLVFSFLPFYRKYQEVLISIPNLFCGHIHFYMIIISNLPDDYVRSALCMMLLYTYYFTGIRFFICFWAAHSFLFAYLLYSIAFSNFTLFEIIYQNFWIVSTNTIGIISAYVIEFVIRRGFVQSQIIEKSKSELEKLAESRKKLSAIGEMASGIVHDIKNPMATIRAFAEMLNQSDLDEETRNEYTNLILREIDRLSDMTFEILDFSKGNLTLNLESHNVQTFLNEIYEFLKLDFDYASIHLELNCNFKETIFFDRDRFRRVLINLANNAREAMSDNKKEYIFTISAFEADEGLRLRLTDNGPGLPASLETKIFEAFATEGKANGTGLGLYMSKLIIEQHNGTLTYETKRDIGTTFKIFIPRNHKEIVL